MRQGRVLLNDTFAGLITENENGYRFEYDAEFLDSADAEPISITLPLRKEVYENKVLFPFFDGLIPEGWLLNIAERNWKIRRHDRSSTHCHCASFPDSFC